MASKRSLPATSDEADSSVKKRRMQRFIPAYSRKYPVLKPSSKGPEYAFCTVCNSDFGVSDGGITNCQRHVENNQTHARKAQSKLNQPTLTMFQKTVDKEDTIKQQRMKAELLFVNFLVEHNVPMSAVDHAGDFFRAMFPDSNIAVGFNVPGLKRQLSQSMKPKKSPVLFRQMLDMCSPSAQMEVTIIRISFFQSC